MGVIAVIEVDKYNNWMVNEYNGKFSVVDCWQNNEDEWIPSFCTIQRRGKDPLKIPKGLGGQFEDLKELRAMLLTLIKKMGCGGFWVWRHRINLKRAVVY